MLLITETPIPGPTNTNQFGIYFFLSFFYLALDCWLFLSVATFENKIGYFTSLVMNSNIKALSVNFTSTVQVSHSGYRVVI